MSEQPWPIPEQAMALWRPSMIRARNPHDQAWLDLRGPARVESLDDFLALPTVTKLVTLVHDVDNARIAVVVRAGEDALLVSDGVRPVPDRPRPHAARMRKAGIRWAPHVALIGQIPALDLWFPCPKCGDIAIAAHSDWLLAEVSRARRSKPRRVALSRGYQGA